MNDLTMARDKHAVIVDLKVTGNADVYNERSFILRPPAFAMSIGRSSSTRDGKFLPQKDNAWFESRVVSREHAVVKASPDMKAVFVEDIGSMHGTFVNECRCRPREKQMLAIGDTIRFGTDVSRGPETFPPLRAVVEYRWINERTANLPAEIRRAFEAFDDNDSDIELIEEPHSYRENAVTMSRTFSVPDSDMSAAGSFISDGEADDLDELDVLQEIAVDEMPSSARTLLKNLGIEHTEKASTDIAGGPSSHAPIPDKSFPALNVNQTPPDVFALRDDRPEATSRQETNPSEPFLSVEYRPSITDILTESDSDSHFSEEYPDFDIEDDLASETSDRSDREPSPLGSEPDCDLNDSHAGRNLAASNGEAEAVPAVLASDSQVRESIACTTRFPPAITSSGSMSANIFQPLEPATAHDSSKDNLLAPIQARAPSPSDAAMPKSTSGSSAGNNQTSSRPNSYSSIQQFYNDLGVRSDSASSALNQSTSGGPIIYPFENYSMPRVNHSLYNSPCFPYQGYTLDPMPRFPNKSASLQDQCSSLYPQPYLYPENSTPMSANACLQDSNTSTSDQPPTFVPLVHNTNKSNSSSHKKVSIEEIVITPEKIPCSIPSPPAIPSLKRKASVLEDGAQIIEETTKETPPAFISNLEIEAIDLVTEQVDDTTEVIRTEVQIPAEPIATQTVGEERPAKRPKTGTKNSPRKLPSYIKYSAVASLSFTMGILGTFWALISLPENFFVQQK